MLKIYCKNTDSFQEFQEGTTLLEMLPAFDFERPYDILSAKVNNVSEGLKFRVFNNRDVEFLDYRSYNGRSIYCRSLAFLLCKSVRDLYPDYRVILRRPISKGYFCTVDKPDGSPVSPEETDAIRAHMQELVAADLPFRRHEVQAAEAIRIFKKLGYEDKVKLLRTCDDVYITYYTLQDTADYFYDALVPSTGLLKVWALVPYRGGMLLRVPDRHAPGELAPFLEQPKTFEIFAETLRWNRIMRLPAGTGIRPHPGGRGAPGKENRRDRRRDRAAPRPGGPRARRPDHRSDQQRQEHLLQAAERATEGLRTAPRILLDGRLFRQPRGHAQAARRLLRFR